ncbi:enoyl-CoA hydratase/isomerase family protein [Corallococcus praedator]|uniref:Enoyl-CoA hydratase/isomerase family protein n=1 Tax=Corallococcus praedator TaxID=2316724 RepID=A0ABX9Q8L6_9BACT|nr:MULTISPECIES: enoyl-CoA hydratase-related protein [Corallococcus]RKH21569.1 enoyl-CoA hydratase/isomerase family protein [Corallococcus sp. CA031C]RKH93905.1 enoyl-CoA hydratase/isomerase family protein [Corallococcus praedator]
MAYENIRLEKDGPLAVLTVDRPKALNALNSATFHEMDDALRSLKFDETRALIVTGGGDKAFVAGADIAEMVTITAAQAREFSALGHHVFQSLENLPIPTIAAVNGFALGGGLELALGCDLIYASEKAKLGLPEVTLGVIPGFGGTQRLTRLVGRSRAKEMLFTADRIDAARAKEIGLVLDVVPADKLMEHCRAVAAKILKNGPLAVAQAKRVVEYGADQDLRSANELERQGFAVLFGSEDQREGMAAFLAKRPAAFQGK